MKIIEFKNEHRKKHFEFFKNMNHPHFSVSGNVDITLLLKSIKEKGYPFMPTIAWAVSKIANDLSVFKQRIRGDEIVEHSFVHPSFTVDTLESDVFSFCEVKFVTGFKNFLDSAVAKINLMKTSPSFEDEPGRDDYLFLSSIPWVSFTGITHAMNYHPHDSVPRITWGKYFIQENKTQMPLSVQAHHALVDGKMVGIFFQKFSQLIAEPEMWLT